MNQSEASAGVDLRTDPLTGARVVITGGRQTRPNLASSGCPFCVGGMEAPGPYELRTFVNRWPLRSAGTPRFVAAGELGSGIFFNPVAPEDAAARLRDLGTGP